MDNVAWLLGINFTVQLVPAAGGRVMHVLAGQSDAVRRRGRELYHAAWGWPASDRASLVVAAIEGDAAQQTWENVGRALQAAGRFVEADGAIAVCCDLAAGPARPCSAGAAHRARGGPAALGKRAAGRCPARRPTRPGPGQHKVYLLSRLDPSVVEDLDSFRWPGRTSWPGSHGGTDRASCFPMPST